MAQNNSTWQNVQNGANPFTWTGGAGDKAGQLFDPFGFTGWNKKTVSMDNPQPGLPAYNAGWNPSMATAPTIGAELDATKLDTTGLDKFRSQALRSSPSQWAALMDQQSYGQQAQAKDAAVAQSRAGVNTAEADLASKGGLSSGARERAERSGARDLLAVGQDNQRQGNLNRMQVGINDEQNRISMLGQLPGMENQVFQDQLQKQGMYDQAYQTDVGRAVSENQNRQAYNQNIYNQQMSAWGANQQANATENSGKK